MKHTLRLTSQTALITRRDFGRISGIGLMGAFLTACGKIHIPGVPVVDVVISAIEVAAKISAAAANILKPLNAKLGSVLETVTNDLMLLSDLYHKYDTGAGDKPTTFGLIQATIATITDNLTSILSAIHVFNPALIAVIRTAVAVVNTAISFIIGHLHSPQQTQARAARMAQQPLPVVDGAKSADDLKKVWNDAVKASYPQAALN